MTQQIFRNVTILFQAIWLGNSIAKLAQDYELSPCRIRQIIIEEANRMAPKFCSSFHKITIYGLRIYKNEFKAETEKNL